jgi:hypothetical protein
MKDEKGFFTGIMGNKGPGDVNTSPLTREIQAIMLKGKK